MTIAQLCKERDCTASLSALCVLNTSPEHDYHLPDLLYNTLTSVTACQHPTIFTISPVTCHIQLQSSQVSSQSATDWVWRRKWELSAIQHPQEVLGWKFSNQEVKLSYCSFFLVQKLGVKLLCAQLAKLQPCRVLVCGVVV